MKSNVLSTIASIVIFSRVSPMHCIMVHKSYSSMCICCIFSIGFIIFIISVGVLASLSFILRPLVIANVALHNGTQTYAQFLQPTIPLRMEFWILEVVNKAEVLDGAMPFMREYGPFTYKEERLKFDLNFNEDDDTITYKQNRTFHFLLNESVASDSYKFTTVNLPLLTLMAGMRFRGALLDTLLDQLLKLFPGEKILKEFSIHDLVWGYNDPFLAAAHEFLPNYVYTSFVGAMTGTNNTYDGIYKVVAGYKDPEHLGQIVTFNGSNLLPYWTDNFTNSILGSDGTLVPPFLNKSSVLPSFISDICSSVYGIFWDETSTHGISLWRFTAPQKEYDNVTLNPENAGYCTPHGQCLPTGLRNLSTCKMVDHFHIPVVMSLPHFLASDEDLVNSVGGMTPPNSEWDRTFVNVEPLSGIVMQIQKRLQINAFIEPIHGFHQLGKVRKQYIPLFWCNESAMIDESLANTVKSMMLTPLFVVKVCLLSMMFIGGLLMVISSVLGIKRHLAQSVDESTYHPVPDNIIQNPDNV